MLFTNSLTHSLTYLRMPKMISCSVAFWYTDWHLSTKYICSCSTVVLDHYLHTFSIPLVLVGAFKQLLLCVTKLHYIHSVQNCKALFSAAFAVFLYCNSSISESLLTTSAFCTNVYCHCVAYEARI